MTANDAMDEAARSPNVVGRVAAAGAAVTGAGSALLATAATACCAGPVFAPLVVGLLGASGAAWAAGLKPYSAGLLAGSGLMLSIGFWSAYRRRLSCELPAAGRRRSLDRVVRVVLWVSAFVWAAAVAVNISVSS